MNKVTLDKDLDIFTLGEKINEIIDCINEQEEPKTIQSDSISCKQLYEENCKLNSFHTMERSLGFTDSFDLQNKISASNYSHCINSLDVIIVCKWLFGNGFDIIREKK